jgi:hypothetical protein
MYIKFQHNFEGNQGSAFVFAGDRQFPALRFGAFYNLLAVIMK